MKYAPRTPYSAAKVLAVGEAMCRMDGVPTTSLNLAIRLGISRRQIIRIRNGHIKRVWPSTADRVAERSDIYIGDLEFTS